MTIANQNIIHCKDRHDWLAQRRNRIQASDTASIFGLGFADQNAWTVWQSKVEKPMIEQVNTEEKHLAIGLAMEPALREIFRIETGYEVEPPEPNAIHVSDEHPFLGATLDGTLRRADFGECVIELKNVGLWQRVYWKFNQIPLRVQIQVQHQMLVTGWKHAGVLALVGGQVPEVRWVERDEKFLSALIPHLEEFQKCVDTRTPPSVDNTYATARVLAELHPDDNGKAIELPRELDRWIAAKAQAKAKIKKLEIIETEANNRIKFALGDNTFGVTPLGKVVSWKTQNNKAYIVDAKKMRIVRSVKKLPKGIEVNERVNLE